MLYSIVRHRFFPSFNPVNRSLTNKTLQFIPLLCSQVWAMFKLPTTHDVEVKKDDRTHLPAHGCGGKEWELCDIGSTSILKYPIYSMEVNNPTSTDIG